MLYLRFTDIQQKAMMGMNIILSIFVDSMKSMELDEIVAMFDYFKADLPNEGSFITELLQWQVRILISLVYNKTSHSTVCECYTYL